VQGWFPFEHREKVDFAKHFNFENFDAIKEEDWYDTIINSQIREALSFVHGFNTALNGSGYRTAKIM
jgi:esterase/lipase superfamily enzyme